MIDLLIRHKRTFILAAALACMLLAGVSVHAQSSNIQLPEATGNAVNDFAGVIDADTKQRLETTLINLKREQKIEFAVVTIKTTGGLDIFDYALALGRKWGIGAPEANSQGLLLLVAVDDRKYFTLVSRHLQGELTDGVVGSIQRQYLVPALRQGDYSKGLMDTVRAYIDTLAEKRGFSTEGIYAPDMPRETRRQPTRRTQNGEVVTGSTCCVIVIVIIILLVLMSSSRRGGGGGSGCLNMLLLGSLLNMGSRGGGWGDSGGWGGGGWGGGSGGDGGGFGGFGGGGDFDGGGAGGSW